MIAALDAAIKAPRDADQIVQRQQDLLRQRIYGLAMGYEDLIPTSLCWQTFGLGWGHGRLPLGYLRPGKLGLRFARVLCSEAGETPVPPDFADVQMAWAGGINDHDTRRKDLRWQSAADRTQELASSPTLCRLENRADRATVLAMSKVLVELFVQGFKEVPSELILDFDATDDRVHGEQEGRAFHGYYGDW